jgi:hypothetical protein
MIASPGHGFVNIVCFVQTRGESLRCGKPAKGDLVASLDRRQRLAILGLGFGSTELLTSGLQR